jgi:colicin import membrane protein
MSDLLEELRDASRAERPRDGAKARALTAVMPELRVASLASRARRMTTVAMAAGFLTFVTAVGGGLYLKHQSDEQAALKAQHEAELAQQKLAMDKLMAQLNAQTTSVQALSAAVQDARDDATRAAVVAQLTEAQRQADATRGALNRKQAAAGGGAGSANRPAKACNCQPGDPLCTCIP